VLPYKSLDYVLLPGQGIVQQNRAVGGQGMYGGTFCLRLSGVHQQAGLVGQS
jgi:hypothetical protein